MGLTPMMRQYLAIHEEVPDALLFFRLGDFYEMFFDDAIKASKELDIVLTGRECGLEEKAPMCGVPFHSVDSYISKLVDKGYKVAICEQIQDPSQAKGIVDRQITRIVSSGTIIEGKSLSQDANNYIACIYYNKLEFGICYADISTGEVHCRLISADSKANFTSFISKLMPAEALCNTVLYSDPELKNALVSNSRSFTPLSTTYFETKRAQEEIEQQLKIFSVDASGIGNKEPLIKACGALFAYLRETQKNELAHINKITSLADNCMDMDYATKRNLELTETMRSASKRGSLLGVLDYTSSAAGARTLRRMLNEPLIDITQISRRHDSIESFCANPIIADEARKQLSVMCDLQRFSSKIGYGSINGREMISLRDTLLMLPSFKELFSPISEGLVGELLDGLDEMPDVSSLLVRSISDDCSANVKDGSLIKSGFDGAIDELKKLVQNSKEILLSVEAKERQASGIKNMKIKYNKVFGYYFEVSNSNLANVQSHFVRRQTLANAERFYTDELKDLESKLLGAQDAIVAIEAKVYQDILSKLTLCLARMQDTSMRLGIIDALLSLAFVSKKQRYVRPALNEAGVINIQDGRHPVIECMLDINEFIPNDTHLDGNANRMLVITGPNMAGKSTYIRQVALIALMNQIGCFVPCTSADLCVVDKVFTRVGASDDIASGQSTFMVEMSEVANIVRNATANSLIILDEVGRGTSTFDGLSIAQAVLEYIANHDYIGAKCLFATHYHELCELEGVFEGVVNYSIRLIQTDEGVVFTHEVVRGPSNRSYGIEVARLAGLPPVLLDRAQELLDSLEASKSNPKTRSASGSKIAIKESESAYNLFNYKKNNAINEIVTLPLDELSPIEVMNFVFKLKKDLAGI
ncbi:MAG: DNA mismatch repair protein MutS [Eubacteriaceae bacterium]|nr:DNA mismatch repair protein MutS [Eubacteriaceae bacterium]